VVPATTVGPLAELLALPALLPELLAEPVAGMTWVALPLAVELPVLVAGTAEFDLTGSPAEPLAWVMPDLLGLFESAESVAVGVAVVVAVEVTYCSGMIPNCWVTTSQTSSSLEVAANGCIGPMNRSDPSVLIRAASADNGSSWVVPSKSCFSGRQATRPTAVSVAARIPGGSSSAASSGLPFEP
jgi:hypothetical protein